ncbi:DUF742 domain-containing protein [Streptomyces fagopyri]|uniref:DUF742 domain-containing protein n=1 Tax=Streptomyces fagopyri TaxID=2662397 RepID=UPI0036D0F922
MTSPGGDRYGTSHQPPTSPQRSRTHAASGHRNKPSALVRPYAMTGGRSRPTHQLAIEALVTTAVPLAQERSQTPEEYRICGLCTEVKSVAEVSALLSIPLGVTRVLVSDLAEKGLVTVHQVRGDEAGGGRPQVTLLEKVLSGLRKLE